MNKGMHTEYLHPSEPEFPVMSMTEVIEDMFKNELSGHKWKKLSFADLDNLIQEKIKKHNIASNDRYYILLKRRLKECTTVEQFILKMGDFFLGDSL